MSEADRPDDATLNRMTRQHLDSLRAAGVDWLPLPETPVVLAARKDTAPTGVSLPMVPPDGPGLPFGGDPAADDPAAMTVEQRKQALAELAATVSKCMRCAELASTRRQTVFGVGPLDPDLCFIGEAPGADEDRQGEPFVGAAGQLLNRILAACGMKREEVFICNILRCRPPKNRTPLPDEAANCRAYLERTLELVRPKYLCALGGCAAQNLLGTATGITRLRGKFYDFKGIPLFCTFHPSYLLHNPEKKRDVWEDMKTLLARMGKPIPGGK